MRCTFFASLTMNKYPDAEWAVIALMSYDREQFCNQQSLEQNRYVQR